MNLSYQRRVAATVLKCGVNRVWIDDRPEVQERICLLYTSPSPRDMRRSRMPSSA